MKYWKLFLIGALSLILLAACNTEKQFPKQGKVDCAWFVQISQELDTLSKDIAQMEWNVQNRSYLNQEQWQSWQKVLKSDKEEYNKKATEYNRAMKDSQFECAKATNERGPLPKEYFLAK